MWVLKAVLSLNGNGSTVGRSPGARSERGHWLKRKGRSRWFRCACGEWGRVPYGCAQSTRDRPFQGPPYAGKGLEKGSISLSCGVAPRPTRVPS